MVHLAASGSRRDEPPRLKAGEKERDAADAHQNSRGSHPEPPSLPQDQTHIPAVRDRRYLRGRFKRSEGFSWIIRLRRKCTAFADFCSYFSLIWLLTLTALQCLRWPEIMSMKSKILKFLASKCKVLYWSIAWLFFFSSHLPGKHVNANTRQEVLPKTIVTSQRAGFLSLSEEIFQANGQTFSDR